MKILQIAEQAKTGAAAAGLTERQGAVLERALGLLVEGGERALTTAGVARAANCSKESLYKWFGDRDGLISAMITYQAGKVRTVEVDARALTAESLRKHLVAFAGDLIDVLSGDVSLAVNRLAIGQASREGAWPMARRFSASDTSPERTSMRSPAKATRCLRRLPAVSARASTSTVRTLPA